MPERRAAGWP